MTIFNFLALFSKIQPFEAIFRTFRPKNQPNQIFPEKMTWVSFKALLTSNLRHNIKKIVRADFEIKMIKSIFRLFLGFFPKNQPNEIFFEKSGSVTFEPLWTPNYMHNIKKIVRADFEKKRYWPTYWLRNREISHVRYWEAEPVSRLADKPIYRSGW